MFIRLEVRAGRLREQIDDCLWTIGTHGKWLRWPKEEEKMLEGRRPVDVESELNGNGRPRRANVTCE